MPTDAQKVLSLVPTVQATATAVQSGNWSDPNVWGGVLPQVDGFVWIPAGITVFQDVSTSKLKKLFIQGEFGPAAGVSCTLWVETMVTDMGSVLFAGDEITPFDGQWNIIFADYGPIDLVSDPWAVSRGLITMGEIEIYGKEIMSRANIQGCRKNDTKVVRLIPCDCLVAGDTIVIPGTTPDTLDDEERVVTSISPDMLTVNFSAPLLFDHLGADRFGEPRQMFIGCLKNRHIDFTSENHTISRRGHVMVMREDIMMMLNLEDVSFRFLGRTDKSRLLTDPDGLGGGLDNPRARYALHFHKCNPDIGGVTSMVERCLVIDSPGWGFVNHDSNVIFDDCLAYKVFGAHFASEIGTETGRFMNCTAVRSTAPFNTNIPSNDRGHADFGHDGTGFWIQGGGAVSVENCTATGATNEGLSVMGFPFVLNGVTTLFNRRDLPAPYTYPKAQFFPSRYVPRHDFGFNAFGCKKAVGLWLLNDKDVANAEIGRSLFENFRGESKTNAIFKYYSSHIDCLNMIFTGTGVKDEQIGIQRTAVTDNTYTNITVRGFAVGMIAPNQLNNRIDNFTHRCLTGIQVNDTNNVSRRIDITNVVGETVDPTELAQCVAIANASPYHLVLFKRQGLQQKNISLWFNESSPIFYSVDATGKGFCKYLQGLAGAEIFKDTLTLDGQQIYFPEMSPTFPLNQSKLTPSILTNLTNGQIWSQYGMTIGEQVLPSDVVFAPNCFALTTSSPVIKLPHLAVNKLQTQPVMTNYQETNLTTGFILKVKNASGVFVQSQLINLVDKSWNIIQMQVDNYNRGVMVWCDSAIIPVVPW